MNTFPTILFFFTLYTPDRIVGSPKPENDVHFHINLGDNVQKQKLPTKETGEDYMERKSFRTSSKTPDGISDIQRIRIFDKAGDYSSEPVKQISLDGKNSEIAEVRPRPSVFAEDMDISECSQFGCEERRISRRERKKLEQCTFEGNLLSDPDSKVSLVACGSDGVKDIQVVSGRTDLESSAYRVKNDGSVTVSNATIESDEVDIEDNGEVGNDHVRSNPAFGDYSLDFLAPPVYAYIDEEGYARGFGEPNSCRYLRIGAELEKNGEKTTTNSSLDLGRSKCKKLKEYVKQRSKEQEKDGTSYNKTFVDLKNRLRYHSGSFKTQLHSWHKKTKTYNQKTIELGVYIDNALYQQIQKIVGKPDDQMVREKIKELVHGLFVNVEDYLTHETFTTIKGGFKVLVNDIIILKGDGPMEAQLSKQTSINGLLHTFRKFVDDFDNNRRKSKKGEKSIDARYLLTFMDVRGVVRGAAFSLTMCYLDNLGVSDIVFDDDTGKADPMTAKATAHEIAHILGAKHDGETINRPVSILEKWDGVARRYKKKIPCPADTYLMGPTLNTKTPKWSQCTQHQIDDEDKLRVKFGLDCLSVG